jgi:hypothetical protein
MKKTVATLALIGSTIAIVSVTNAMALPKLSLTLTGLTGTRDGNGFTYVGPGARLDLGLGFLFMLSPEVSYFPGNGGGLVPGATLNVKIWKLFAGGGATFGLFKEGSQTLFKANIGARIGHWLLVGSYYIWSDSVDGIGLTAGYVS